MHVLVSCLWTGWQNEFGRRKLSSQRLISNVYVNRSISSFSLPRSSVCQSVSESSPLLGHWRNGWWAVVDFVTCTTMNCWYYAPCTRARGFWMIGKVKSVRNRVWPRKKKEFASVWGHGDVNFWGGLGGNVCVYVNLNLRNREVWKRFFQKEHPELTERLEFSAKKNTNKDGHTNAKAEIPRVARRCCDCLGKYKMEWNGKQKKQPTSHPGVSQF